MHNWNISFSEAIALQKQLAEQVVCVGVPKPLSLIAGIDLAYSKKSDLAFCVITLLHYPSMVLEASYQACDRIKFPYIPGLLSFREGPLIMETLDLLPQKPDLLIFDGQGIAHPRGLGIAAHLGVLLNMPTIGCAKSRLFGRYEEPGINKGDRSPLVDVQAKLLGYVLRTRQKVKPVFVSPGHRVNPQVATDIVLNCATKYRLPEPTRQADKLVEIYKKKILATGFGGGSI